MSKQRQDPEHPVKRQAGSDRRWDSVDETSWESFPASDPPGWTASTVDRRSSTEKAKRKR